MHIETNKSSFQLILCTVIITLCVVVVVRFVRAFVRCVVLLFSRLRWIFGAFFPGAFVLWALDWSVFFVWFFK